MFLLIRYTEVTHRYIPHIMMLIRTYLQRSHFELNTISHVLVPGITNLCCIITSSFGPSPFIPLQFSVPISHLIKQKLDQILWFYHNALKHDSCTILPNCIHSDTRNAITAASKLCWSETGRGSKRFITTTKFKTNTVKSL